MSQSFHLSTAKWNELQKLYKRSKHSDFNGLDGTQRMMKLKQDWKGLKQLNALEQHTAYILIIDQYKLGHRPKQNKRKRVTKQSIKCEKDVKPPPYKRSRIGSKHRKHKTPVINKLNKLLKEQENELDDVTVLLSAPNQSVEQIAARQNKRKQILKETEIIKYKITFRKQNNESCKRSRYRKKEVTIYKKQVDSILEIPPLENV
eukprot:339395_1